MDFNFQYRMDLPPRTLNDGSGMVVIRITAMYQDQLTADPDEWFIVPGRSKDFCVPAEDVEQVLSVPVGQALDTLKVVLAANLNTTNEPVTGWGAAELETYMDNNLRAQVARDDLDELITTYKTYPFVFS